MPESYKLILDSPLDVSELIYIINNPKQRELVRDFNTKNKKRFSLSHFIIKANPGKTLTLRCVLKKINYWLVKYSVSNE